MSVILIRNLMRSTVMRSLLVAGLLIFGPGLVAWLRMSWKHLGLTRETQQLQATHQQLVTQQVRLTTDPVYVEGLIRSTFKVAKPGELVIPSETLDDAARSR